MELRGTLQSFQVAEVVQLLAHAAKTGVLRVWDASDTKLLGFCNGQLCYAVHQRKLPRLREIILHRALAGPEEVVVEVDDPQRWDDAVSRALARRRQSAGQRALNERWLDNTHGRAEDSRLGRVLVAQGRLGEADLAAATDPTAIPDAQLASIVRAAGLIEAEVLAAALARASGLREPPSLAARLVGEGLLSGEQLADAVAQVSDESLAELLVQQGAVGRAEIRHWLGKLQALRARALPAIRVGEYLLEKGRVSQTELERALWEQLVKDRRLGDILVDQGAISAAELAQVMEEIEALRADFGPLHALRQKLTQHYGIEPSRIAAALADRTPGATIADLLVESGKIPDDQMRTAVQQVLVEELCDLLLWTDASFEFLAGFALEDAVTQTDYREVHGYAFEAGSMLLEAHALLDELRRTPFRDLTASTVLIAALPDDDHEDAPPPRIPDFARGVNGRRPLRDLCRVIPGNRLAQLRMFARLVADGRLRPLERDEAFVLGQEALHRGHSDEGIALFEHALDAPGNDPPSSRLRRALADAHWGKEHRALPRAALGARRTLRMLTELPSGMPWVRRLAASLRCRAAVRAVAAVCGGARAFATRAGRATRRVLFRARLHVEAFLIRIGLDRQLWVLQTRLADRWSRLPGTRRVTARGTVAAGAVAAVLAAWLTLGAPHPPVTLPPPAVVPAAVAAPDRPLRRQLPIARFTAAAPVDVAPAAAADRIYVATREGVLRALRPAPPLDPVWEVQLGEFGDVLSPPVVVGDLVLVNNVRGRACAVSTDGEVRWERRLPRVEPIAPVPLRDAGGALAGVAIASRECVLVLSPADGTVLFRLPTGNRIVTAPAGDAELLFVGSGDNHVYCAAWPRGNVLWEHEETDDVTALVRSGDAVVVGTRNGFVAALEARSGEAIWRRSFDRGAIAAVGTLAPGAVYLLVDGRRYEAIDVGTGSTISSFVPDAELAVDRLWFDGVTRLYVSTSGHLGELDAGGSVLWRSAEPFEELSGFALGPGLLAVTSRSGQVALFHPGGADVDG